MSNEHVKEEEMSESPSPGYEDLGNIPITGANDANIPVDIWLTPGEDDDDGFWVLSADNYMPRKGRLSGEDSYKARARDRDVLVGLVRARWLPLYQSASRILESMAPDSEGVAQLYYWRSDHS